MTYVCIHWFIYSFILSFPGVYIKFEINIFAPPSWFIFLPPMKFDIMRGCAPQAKYFQAFFVLFCKFLVNWGKNMHFPSFPPCIISSINQSTWCADNGADVNVLTAQGRSPLLYAASKNHPDIVRYGGT